MSAPLAPHRGNRPRRGVFRVILLFFALFALPACTTLQSPARRAQELYRQGQRRFAAGEKEEALRLFRESLEAAEKGNAREAMAANLHAMALSHVDRREWTAALGHLERALELDRALLRDAEKKEAKKKRIEVLETKLAADLSYIARLHRRMGEPEKMAARLEELLELDLRRGRTRGAAITHNNLARVLLALDRFDEARRHYRAAILLFEKLQDPPRAEAVRRNLLHLERIQRSRRGESGDKTKESPDRTAPGRSLP